MNCFVNILKNLRRIKVKKKYSHFNKRAKRVSEKITQSPSSDISMPLGLMPVQTAVVSLVIGLNSMIL